LNDYVNNTALVVS